MPGTPALDARIAAAMTQAQSGNPRAAADAVRVVIDELRDGGPSYQLAAAEYVRTVAAHHAGEVDEALAGVDACLQTGRAIDEPGWEANALPMRVVTLNRAGRGGEEVADLVAAENALEQTTDEALAGWAHTGIGYAYDLLRLYELCIPHFEIAATIDTDPLGLAESRAIQRLNLAESNMRWAQEMERLGDPSYDERIEERRAAANRWAKEAIDLVEVDRPDDYWLVSSRLWLAASDRDTDPDEAAVVLRDCRDRLTDFGIPELPSIAGAYLAGAYARLGRGDDAVRAAAQAVADLPATSDPPVETMVRHTLVRVRAAAGEPGAREGLDYARSIARGWWAERLRGLYAVRAALANHDLSARHDAERRAAREDPLTGVGNRRALTERMTLLAEAGRSAAVVAVDVDNLKLLNDSHGHQRGDDVLRAVAGLLVDQSRVEDLVARTGGDEFVVLMDRPGERGATELVERIRQASAAVAAAAQQPWLAQLRLSIGQASSADGFGIDELLAQADSRMYADKRRRPSA
jgi:diguanylate cyclase (GGDEF)-like protein